MSPTPARPTTPKPPIAAASPPPLAAPSYGPPMMAPPQSADEAGPPVPGRLRPVPVAKTILLGIITLSVYFHMRAFKLGGDLQRMPGGWEPWKLFFWLQFIPYAGLVFLLILYFKNNKQSNILRGQRGLAPSYVPFILACIPIVNLAAPFVWASHYNELAVRT
jgi:hypothetical protein